MKTPPLLKYWNIKRTVVEEFQVRARSKKEALATECIDPHTITVKKTVATKQGS